MTTHDDMCTCDRCMREDSDRTLQRAGDLERENARLREALQSIKDRCDRIVAGQHGGLDAALEMSNEALRALEGGPS